MALAVLKEIDRPTTIAPVRSPVPAGCSLCSLRRLALCSEGGWARSESWRFLAPAQRRMPARSQIHIEGEPVGDLTVISRGWAFRYKMLPDGRRQILDFLIPGDIVALPADHPVGISHSIEALTSVVTCSLPGSSATGALDARDGLSAWIAAARADIERRMLEHFVSVGRRDALERLSHLLLELHWRMTVRGLAFGNTCVFPASQHQIGDAIALTNAHVSRLFRRLKEMGIVESSNAKIVIQDIERLRELCGFDDSYLPANDAPVSRALQ